MYLPTRFEVTDRALLVELMRRHPFGTIVGIANDEPEIAHLPLLVEETPLRIAAHVARGNPLARLAERGAPLTAVFHGPHAYVSPRFYRTTPNVPTWNYAVVHARGRARVLPDDAVMPHLERMVSTFERGAWRIDADFAAQLMGGIVAFEITVEELRGKLKLNQNREPEDWAGVVSHFEGSDDPGEREMVELMKRLGPP